MPLGGKREGSGRKPIITKGELERLASLQCTQPEIAAFFGVSLKAVEAALRKDDMRDCYERGRQRGLISLRRAQFQKALEGNATMLIWLGKQLLGQKDQMEHAGDLRLTLTDVDSLILASRNRI